MHISLVPRLKTGKYIFTQPLFCVPVCEFFPVPAWHACVCTHVLVTSHKEMGMAAVSCFLALCGGLQCCCLVGPVLQRHEGVAQLTPRHTCPPFPACPVHPWCPVSSRGGVLPSLGPGAPMATTPHSPLSHVWWPGPLAETLLLSQLVVEKCSFSWLEGSIWIWTFLFSLL